MMLNSVLGPMRPLFNSSVQQTRNLRPYLKICKEKVQISVDCRQFNREGIWVQAHPEYLVVAGKQEQRSNQGIVRRQFMRKFKLPVSCCHYRTVTRMSPEGILTITTPRICGPVIPTTPCQAVYIPITHCKPVKCKKIPPEEAKKLLAASKSTEKQTDKKVN